jgi:hypothetical protein
MIRREFMFKSGECSTIFDKVEIKKGFALIVCEFNHQRNRWVAL